MGGEAGTMAGPVPGSQAGVIQTGTLAKSDVRMCDI